MWVNHSVLYQIYPLGACNAPFEQDYQLVSRIKTIEGYLDDLEKLEIDCILLNPIFYSHTHGYDTIDYKRVDPRLGTTQDVQRLIQKCHQKNIKVLFDAVFNHVGRGHLFFQDVLKNREQSQYKDWFEINFYGNNQFNDGLSYSCWEGHQHLVKWNLRNWDVRDYLLDVVDNWIDTFKIDGIRLDVAYSLDREFLTWLRGREKYKNPDFFLLGETLHGDYNLIMNDSMLDSVTNYECYKGIYSSFNSLNFYEILYSLNRQFGKDPWCLYTGKHLVNFLDNHDVNRIASLLENKNHLPLVYVMLFTMPGIPCIYYGSEWGIEGIKNQNDTSLRPAISKLEWNDLTTLIHQLIQIKHRYTCLHTGDYTQIFINNKQCIYQRSSNQDTLWIVMNADKEKATLYPNTKGQFKDVLTNEIINIDGKLDMEGCTFKILEKIN